MGTERTRRLYFLQQCPNFPNRGVKETMFDANAMSRFDALGLGCGPTSKEAIAHKFCHPS